MTDAGTAEEAGSVTPDGAGAHAADESVEPNPLADRRFLVFAAGNAANNVGEALYATALPLLAYQLTDSLVVMAWLAAAVPVSDLFAPALGAWADRRGVRGLIVQGLLAQAGAALAMNLLLLGGHSAPWLLFLCAVVLETGGLAYRTGWMTGVPAQFPDCPVRARGTLNSLFLATTLAGPLLVAALLPWVGYQGLLWLNLPTFFAPLVVWAVGVRPARSAPASPHKTAPASPDETAPASLDKTAPAPSHEGGRTDGGPRRTAPRWVKRRAAGAQARAGAEAPPSRIRDGWDAIRQDKRISVMLVADMVLSAVCGTGLTSLIVYHLRHGWALSGQQAGLAIAGMNVASLVGNLLVSQRRRLRPWTPMTLGVAARSVALILMIVPVWPVFMFAVVLGALGQGAVMATVVMARVRYLPPGVLGRASGLIWLLTGGAALLSPVFVSALDDVVGTPPTFLVLGIATTTVLLHLRLTRAAWRPVPRPQEPARRTNEP
ncbi:MFS transporter [Streptomyces sp. SID8382]|uniref:MFS transporter n=1 Tax=Streptomyces malaysiensis TaxID=92644 RepID=UPI000C2BEAFB|nr:MULTISPECIES: MFS transporter [unclassified Streptomyces]MCC4318072.1 MFS transporter [Streptomyces malaysiensis]AUA14121.1 Major Facilitator Superfamily protein [Streptomyces sp. M56]MCQ6249286.1 MFS transporter [Streptomyces malaysiensis]MYX57029.1 MFS transporter [Streptomyces sp. SID8382]WHX21248.1 MFS transporter [Streptomyces sp. NA07423]